MKINESYETDYWEHVILEWESNNGSVYNSTIHNHKAELEQLSEKILDELDELENNPTGFHNDPGFDYEDLRGYPDRTLISREYSHKLVTLFALSSGIMEQQLGILLTVDLIPNSRRDSYINKALNSMSLGRKLEFSRDVNIIGNGVFSESWDVKKARDRLVHNPAFRLTIQDYNNHRNRIKKATRAPDKIDELIQNAI